MTIAGVGQNYNYVAQNEMQTREQTQRQVEQQNSDQQRQKVQDQTQMQNQKAQDQRSQQQQQVAAMMGVGANINISA